MSKDGHVHFSDRSRQAALFETMILAAGSDGSVSKVSGFDADATAAFG